MTQDSFERPQFDWLSRFDWLEKRLAELDSTNMRRRMVERSMCGKFIEQNSQRLINFGSNDYLGIAMESSEVLAEGVLHDDLVAELGGLAQGATSSPLVCGYSPLHRLLCDRLTELEQTEATVMFPSGFAACSGVAATLPEAGDVILSDSLNHASLIDGCRLSKAEKFIYPHRDVSAVRALLSSHRGRFRRAFIITDSIFSMDGTIAPISELCDIADRFEAIMIVDEAHATGVFGNRGSGICEELGVEHRVPIRIGTLSKAIGAQGGFVTGPRLVIDYLTQHARSLVYSTAAPPLIIAAALRGLRIATEQPERRLKVRQLANVLLSELRTAGLKSSSERTPIVPVILSDAGQTLTHAQTLADAGFYVPAIRPPTVPEKSSRLRISLSAAHDVEDIERLAHELSR